MQWDSLTNNLIESHPHPSFFGLLLLFSLLYYPAFFGPFFVRTWPRRLLLYLVPVAASIGAVWLCAILPHTLPDARSYGLALLYPIVIYGAFPTWVATFFWGAILNPSKPPQPKTTRPPTIDEVAADPDRYDFANLAGAATFEDLRETGLLILGRELPRASKKAPRAWTWPDPLAYPDRLILGRFYDTGGRTSWWVAPHLDRIQQTVVVAPPGAGKTYSIALPWSLDIPRKGHSVFALDVKGNMADKLRPQWPRGARLSYFNPADPKNSLHWNPFDEIDRSDPLSHAFFQGVSDLAEAIFGRVQDGPYQFFDTLDQRAIRAGVLLLCLTRERPSLRDLVELYDSESTIKVELERLRARAKQEPDLERHHRDAKRDLEAIASGKRHDFQEAVAGIRNRLELIGSPALERVTRSGPFRLRALDEHPCLFVCAAPLSMGRAGTALAAVVLRMVHRMLTGRFGGYRRKLFLILDEFSKLELDHKQTEDFISASREAGAVSVIILQDVTQVHEHLRHALLANCKDRLVLHGVGTETAKWCQQLLGERVRYQVSAGQSQNYAGFLGVQQSAGRSVNVTQQTVPVIGTREIMSCVGLRWGAWALLSEYHPKPILINLWRE